MGASLRNRLSLIRTAWVSWVLLTTSAFADSELPKDYFSMSLDELMDIQVTTSSKELRALSDSPGTISVISRQQISAYGASDLVEALELATSTFVTGSYMFPQSLVSMRGNMAGLYNIHVLFLIDGRPLRENQNGGTPMALLAGFPIALVEQIEIVRGPGSVLYGTGAFDGVVNIITRDNTSLNNTLDVRVGEDSLYKVSATLSDQFGDTGLVFGATIGADDGWLMQAKDETGNSFSRQLDDQHGGIYLGLNKQGLSARLTHTWVDKGHIGTLPIAALFASDANIESERSMFDIGYQTALSDAHRLQSHVTLNRFKADYVNPGPQPSYMSALDVLGEVSWHSQWSESLSSVTGGSWKHLSGDSAGFHQARQQHVTIIPDYSESYYRAYSEWTYALSHELSIIGGLQLNKPKNTSTNISTRFSALYRISPQHLVKFQYGEAFRSASMLEQYITLPGIVVGQPLLSPEVGKNTEIQYQYIGERNQVTATWYVTRTEDVIQRIPDNVLGATYINVKKHFTSQGAELEGRFKLGEQHTLDYGITWISHDESDVLGPERIGKLGLSGQLSDAINYGVSASFLGHWHEEHDVRDFNSSPNTVLTLNAKMSYKLTDAVQLYLKGQNLLDRASYQPEFVRGVLNSLPVLAPRQLVVGLHWQL